LYKIALIVTIFATILTAREFSFAPEPHFQTKLHTPHGWCSFSGENLLQSYKTNFIATLSDAMVMQYASIRFLASDFDAIKDRIVKIETVDAVSGEIIDVKDAFFVVNSNIEGLYSKYPKIAFKNKSDAVAFTEKYGGDIRDFDFTFYMADRDLDLDGQFTKNKELRQIKRGEKIYTTMCEKIDVYDYISLTHLKRAVKELGLCKNLNEKNLQALSTYLWSASSFEDDLKQNGKISVPKEAKCPVCGMFVAKYPKWVGKITLENGTAYYFDGAKDLFKYYFNPEKFTKGVTKNDFQSIEVTNYYTLESIEAQKAFYVIGSNVYGPMGHELIAFTTAEEAYHFKNTRFGEAIVTFDQITVEKVYGLDR